MIKVVLTPKKDIKVALKPEQGIQIEATKKYLFDPTVVQSYVDASAENAIKAEEQANRVEQVFADVTVFVDNSKTEINEIIEQGKTDINTAVDNGRMEISDSILEATEEVKKAGSEAAQEAVQGAADEATRIATEQVNTYVVEVVSPQIQEFVNNAEADASNAAESAGLAAEEANKSSVSASDSQHYAEDARIWAEGEQAEVKPLGGELSSMGAADLAYALANAPEDTPIDASGLFAMNVVKGEKGDKGDKGDAGKDGVDGKDGDKLPSQEGNAGKFLKTDGENTLWDAVDLSSKANTNLNNISSNIDYVIENYVSGVNWYQKYKSKKIIQGGLKTFSATTQPNVTINFVKAFANANVTVVAIQRCNSTWVWGGVKNGSVNASSFIFQGGGNTGGDTTDGIYWIAVGQGS